MLKPERWVCVATQKGGELDCGWWPGSLSILRRQGPQLNRSGFEDYVTTSKSSEPASRDVEVGSVHLKILNFTNFVLGASVTDDLDQI